MLRANSCLPVVFRCYAFALDNFYKPEQPSFISLKS
jgi:hypothetical protein